VFRALLIVAVLCGSFELSGLAAALGDGDCSESCPTEKSGGDCAPNCRLCGCCSLPRTAGAQVSAAAPILHLVRISWPRATGTAPCPEPRAILHVPKLLLT
jgi:hypothetical protein